MFALIQDGRVLQTGTGKFPVNPALAWADITAVNPAPQPGWWASQVNAAWVFAAPMPPTPPPPNPVLMATAFLNRITPQEQAALASAAMTQPQMLLWLINMAAATSIDLTDPAVQAGVNGLVPTVLTSARAAAILTP